MSCGYTTSSACYKHGNDVCVWLNNQCQTDPCAVLQDASSCTSAASCVFVAGGSSTTNQCYSSQRLCSLITSQISASADVCQSYPWCLPTTDKTACYYYEPGQSSASGPSTENCLSFPSWSIAIIVLWVLVMAILGGVIALALRQRRLDAIAGMESEDVYVEHVPQDTSIQKRGGGGGHRGEMERPLNDDRF